MKDCFIVAGNFVGKKKIAILIFFVNITASFVVAPNLSQPPPPPLSHLRFFMDMPNPAGITIIDNVRVKHKCIVPMEGLYNSLVFKWGFFPRAVAALRSSAIGESDFCAILGPSDGCIESVTINFKYKKVLLDKNKVLHAKKYDYTCQY